MYRYYKVTGYKGSSHSHYASLPTFVYPIYARPSACIYIIPWARIWSNGCLQSYEWLDMMVIVLEEYNVKNLLCRKVIDTLIPNTFYHVESSPTCLGRKQVVKHFPRGKSSLNLYSYTNVIFMIMLLPL